MPTITVDATLAQQISANLANALANSPHPLAEQFRLRLGWALLQGIAFAFEKRSGPAGPQPGFGPPAAGYAWLKLQPSTIARRRIGSREKKSLTKQIKTAKQTASQRRQFVSKRKKELTGTYVKQGDEVAQAASRAARDAEKEARIKYPGYSTKADVLGSRAVMILRDTGRLFSSIQPGQIIAGKPKVASGQILTTIPGAITVGTNVEYADVHHMGKGHVPARPLWPEPDWFPQDWWDDVNEQAALALSDVLSSISLPEMLATV